MPSEAYNGWSPCCRGHASRLTPPSSRARVGWDSMEGLLPLAPDVTIEETKIGELAARWLTPPGAGGTTVLHLHGGGYVIGSAKSHTPFASHLAATLGCSGVGARTTDLRPEHPAPAAIDDTVDRLSVAARIGHRSRRHRVLAATPQVAGLAVATMAQLRDTLLPLPGAAALISPWTDATFDFDEHANEGRRGHHPVARADAVLARVLRRFDAIRRSATLTGIG